MGELISKLPPKVRERAKENIKNLEKGTPSDNLKQAFIWVLSPEGINFWKYVYFTPDDQIDEAELVKLLLNS